jgi:hypothetical protein
MTNLDGVTMFVSGTASNGVVDTETRLHFRQKGARVYAHYSGGRIARGLLVGRWIGEELHFRYAQREADGAVHGGASVCDVLEHAGRLRIVEHFAWSTRVGTGVNVFDEVADAPRPQLTDTARP